MAKSKFLTSPSVTGETLTRELILGRLTNEQGKQLKVLPWWTEGFTALDDPLMRELLMWLRRQSGKTTFLAVGAIIHLLTVRHAYIIFVSASENQASAIFHRKIRRPLERLLKAAKLENAVSITARSLEFIPGNAALEVIAPNEATAPGRSPTLLIFDEARDIPDALYLSLAPSTIGSGGKIIIASSAGRPTGFFYELINNPTAETVLIHHDGSRAEDENPHADQGLLGWLRRRFAHLSPSAGQRELENQFTEDGDSFLSAALIEAAIDEHLSDTLSSDAEAFAFIDLSRKKDLTSRVVVLREPSRRVDAKDHLVAASVRVWNPKDSPTKEINFGEVRADLLRLVQRFPNLRQVLIDEGAEAGSVLSWAKDQALLSSRVHGFIATASSNMDLWSALAARLHAQTVSIPRHERLIAELKNLRQESFQFGMRWRITDGSKKLHRDVSLSLAGAILAESQLPKLEPLRLLNPGAAPMNRSEQEAADKVEYEARAAAGVEMVRAQVFSRGTFWPGE